MSQPELARLELLAEIDALVDRMNRWAEAAPAWQPAERCRALVRRLTERAASLRVRIEAPLVVATLGGTGTGKSALVNAIVGTEIVQTGRSRPTTMRPTLVTRPDITPELLGIDRATVEWVPCDQPALRDLVLVDCPDPDTSEDSPTAAHASDNLARLRAILPQCDVLLVTSTQQKYRSARVADELAAAAPGAHLIFVQTHADQDDDIREDWRQALEKNGQSGHIFRVDSLHALADAKQGMQPRGEFADLLDLLTRQMAGAAGNRIRRANFLELSAETLDLCRQKIDEAVPRVRETQNTLDQQRAELSLRIAGEMQAGLLSNRRQWENRLLGQTTSRWGLSPFSLVLRIYQGIGGLLSGALLYRARTPAQMALWGAWEGVRTWRKHRQSQQAERGAIQTVDGFDAAQLRTSAIIVEGYTVEAGLPRETTQWETVSAEAASAAAAFIARVSVELESLIARLAKRHTGWFTRFRYELLLAAMLVALLYRSGKNFFYDSWLAEPPAAVFGLDYYISALFWLVLWCMLLLWMFCGRLRRGLRGEVAHLAAGWQDGSTAANVFQRVETECRRAEHFQQELQRLRNDVETLRRQLNT